LKRQEKKTIEMRVYVPQGIHRLLVQRQNNNKQLDKPFKSLSDFALDALIDGLFREAYCEQLQKMKEQRT